MCLYMLLGILKVHVRRGVAPAHDVKRSCAHGCAIMQDVCEQGFVDSVVLLACAVLHGCACDLRVLK